MEAKDRIIVALDMSDAARLALAVKDLSPYVGSFKIGLEAIHSIGDEAYKIVHHNGGRVFYDAKLHDIPNTVHGAAKAIAMNGVRMFNVHCSGGKEMMEAAAEGVLRAMDHLVGTPRPIVLGVTILTSLDFKDLVETGFLRDDIGACPDPDREQIEASRVRELVRKLACLARESRLDGVVCSSQEIEEVRAACGKHFLIVTPGIRPAWAATNDQKRVMTPGEAIKAGADYLVIGRPILKPPSEIGSPVEAAKRIAEEIEIALASRVS